jgi:hypothetical protein
MSKGGAPFDEGSGGILLTGVPRKVESPGNPGPSPRLGPLDYLTMLALSIGAAVVLWTLVR